ncbi:BON domain-containing protein [Dulcicalothrix desertica]|nr:BON domain-containing protein [Dulcicalothrix desertica]
MTQVGNSNSKSKHNSTNYSTILNDSNEEAVLEGFINLLADLNIITSPETGTLNHEEITTIEYEEISHQTIKADSKQSNFIELTESLTESSSDAKIFTDVEYAVIDFQAETVDSSSNFAAFEQLQSILVGPELTDLQLITDKINNSLSKLEHQIYDPNALVELLVPCIHEILRVKIGESREDIVKVITPIIDEVIQNRTQQSKISMGVAFAPIIPEAISQQINNAPDEMTEALAPTMGRAIKKQIEIEQDSVVDALYPIIGSTISKYMAETIRAINQQIEDSLSVKGIQRKIRAKLQGISEAELIFREAIHFTVQAIFLIHKTSGLVISDIQRLDAQQLESEMVAGMLTAIRSFANDCIIQSGAYNELDAIEYGTSKIILEVAGYCYLAIVVKGEPPKQFISKMRQMLINIVREHGTIIENFDGDPGTIPNEINVNLKNLRDYDLELDVNHKNKPSPLILLTLGILGAIFIPLGIWKYHTGVIDAVEQKTSTALASAPELAVYRLNVEEHHGKLKLTGRVPNQFLSQKAAQIASYAAPKWSIDNQILAVEVPADPVTAAAEVKRVTEVFNQIKSTAISTQYTNGRVLIQGSVRNSLDVTMITNAFEKIPGVKLVSSAIEVPPAKIGIRFYFNINSEALMTADFDSKIEQVKSFLNQYPIKRLKITGYSYSHKGNSEYQKLGLKRAQTVKKVLINQGINGARLEIAGKTSLPPGVDINQPEWQRRSVVLEPD